MLTPTWTDERTELLKSRHADGQSGSQIAAELGMTRNAVIGKMHRLGLFRNKKPREKPWEAEGVSERTWQRRRAPSRQATPQAQHKFRRLWNGPNVMEAIELGNQATDLRPEVAKNPVSFAELEHHHCRWPIPRDGGPVMYCGMRKLSRVSYCALHCSMAYVRDGK